MPALLVGLQYPGPPVIVREPHWQGVGADGNATFSVVAASGVAQTYQWYAGASGDTNRPIAGATNATYTVQNLATNATYWTQIANSAGSTNSAAAEVPIEWLGADAIGGLPALTVHGFPGATYGIDLSDSVITNWTRMLDLTLHGGGVTFIDRGGTNATARFYRLVPLSNGP